MLTLCATSAAASPIVSPVSVMAADADAGNIPLYTVIMTELALCEVRFTMTPPLHATEGDGKIEKKFAGYWMVIVPPVDISPPSEGENTKVALAFILLAKRSDKNMVNDVNDTLSPIVPLAHGSNSVVSGSLDVITYMPVALLALTCPVTKPVNVTVTGTLANMSPLPDVVITRADEEGASAVPATFK
jgi:hypothetical protein